MITGNIPYRILENPDFIATFQILRPSYKLPSRHFKFQQKLIPNEYEALEAKIRSYIENSSSISLSSDSWTDINGRTIMNVIVHIGSKAYLYKFIDVSDDNENGEYVASKLIEVIEEIGATKIAAVVTDHASAMRKAWRLIQEKYPWIQGEGCKGHGLNLESQDLLEKGGRYATIQSCAKIVQFFK